MSWKILYEKDLPQVKQYIQQHPEFKKADKDKILSDFEKSCKQQYAQEQQRQDFSTEKVHKKTLNKMQKSADKISKTTTLDKTWTRMFDARSHFNEHAAKNFMYSYLSSLVCDKKIAKGSDRQTPLKLHCIWIQDSRCLEENTSIITENGFKPIKEIIEGEKVLGYNYETDKYEFNASYLIDNGEHEVYEIELEDGSIVQATENHKFFSEGKEVLVKDLKEDDLLDVTPNLHTDSKKRSRSALLRESYKTKEQQKVINKTIRTKAKDRWKDPEWIKKELHNRRVLLKDNYRIRALKNSVNFKGRKVSKDTIKKCLETRKKNGIPAWNKGLTKHTDYRVMKISKSNIGKAAGEKNPSYGKVCYPSRIYIKELDLKVKSSWEQEFALMLYTSKLDVMYETITYKLDIGKTYTPDFKLGDQIIEIKAYIKDWTKMLAFKEQFQSLNDVMLTKNKEFKLQALEKGFKCFMFDEIEVTENGITAKEN